MRVFFSDVARVLLSYSSILISYILSRDEKSRHRSRLVGRPSHTANASFTRKKTPQLTLSVFDRLTHLFAMHLDPFSRATVGTEFLSHTHPIPKPMGIPCGSPYPRQTCHLDVGTATGTHMPYRITQCYLPPGTGDIPALTSAEAGTRLSDHGPSWSPVQVLTGLDVR